MKPAEPGPTSNLALIETEVGRRHRARMHARALADHTQQGGSSLTSPGKELTWQACCWSEGAADPRAQSPPHLPVLLQERHRVTEVMLAATCPQSWHTHTSRWRLGGGRRHRVPTLETILGDGCAPSESPGAGLWGGVPGYTSVSSQTQVGVEGALSIITEKGSSRLSTFSLGVEETVAPGRPACVVPLGMGFRGMRKTSQFIPVPPASGAPTFLAFRCS